MSEKSRKLEDVLVCSVPGCQARAAPFREWERGKLVAHCGDHLPRDYLGRAASPVRLLMEVVGHE